MNIQRPTNNNIAFYAFTTLSVSLLIGSALGIIAGTSGLGSLRFDLSTAGIGPCVAIGAAAVSGVSLLILAIWQKLRLHTNPSSPLEEASLRDETGSTDKAEGKVSLQTFEEKKPLTRSIAAAPPGLPNPLSYRCYMNSSLQCLLHSELFLEKLLACKADRETMPVTFGLQTLFRSILSAKKGELEENLQLLQQAIGRSHPLFATKDQQDAQEFLSKLFECMRLELASPREEEIEPAPFAEAQAALYWREMRVENSTFLFSLLTRMWSTTLSCEASPPHESRTFEGGSMLAVDLPDLTRWGEPFDLQTAIDRQAREQETLSGENRWFCSGCGALQKALRTTTPPILTPPLLIVQLKRFAQEGRRTQKNCAQTQFSETMTLGESTYRLQSLVLHHSTHVYRGHYTAITRSEARWHRYDDSQRTDLPSPPWEMKEIQSQVYLLFYEKIS